VCPAFDWIPSEYLDNVVGLLTPGKLDFATSASLIQAEQYWARLSKERWGPASEKSTGVLVAGAPNRRDPATTVVSALDLSKHGQSWKRLYCEKHLAECLENYHHSKQTLNYKRLLKEVEACKPYVHSIVLSSLSSHLDLNDIFYDFPLLHSLSIHYGPGSKKIGMDYDKYLFGISLNDAVSLAKLLGSSGGPMSIGTGITRLELRENLIGDEAILLLMSGLHPAGNAPHSLTYLDLSHNKIGDLGAKRLAQLLDGGLSQQTASERASNNTNLNGDPYIGTVLTELNLSDNHIRSAGAQAFGAALSNNRGLIRLDLSLNSLGDIGGSALLSGCMQHISLRELIISSTELGIEACDAFINLLKLNRSLENISLACNPGLFENINVSSSGIRSGSQSGISNTSSNHDIHQQSNSALLSGGNVGAGIFEALKANEQIHSLDMRRNGLNNNIEDEMKQLLAKRLAKVKQNARKAFQKDWDAAM
jgi:hypothetical protein